MQNETMVLDAPQAPTVVNEKQAAAWVGMAAQKNKLTHDLQQMELKAQGLLLPHTNSKDYTAIDAALGAYRKLNTDITETRKAFTNMIDAAIVQPLMQYEKRVKDFELYATLTAKSLSLRKEETDKANQQNLKNQAIANFKAHCANEFYKAKEDLRGKIRKEISKQYQLHLTNRISPTIEKIYELLRLLKPEPSAKFNTNLVTNEELAVVYDSLMKPDYEEIYKHGHDSLISTFSNFDSDLANAAAAIRHQQDQAKLADAKAATAMAEETAINTLIAHSETVVIDTPKIKKTLVVTVVESEQWAKTIMAAFIANMQHMSKYIKVKSWSKLTIGQMAEYLGKYSTDEGHKVANLIYEEVEK